MDTHNYQIRVKGHLDDTLASRFEELKISNLEGGDAVLSGPLPDQSALQGVLKRISSLGLTLISVNTVPEEEQVKSTFIERYALPAFLILTLLISLAIPIFLPLPSEIVPLMMVFVPALLAIFLTVLTDGRKGVVALLKRLFRWRIGFRWYVFVFGLAFGLRLTMSVLALLLGWIPAIQISPWSFAESIILGVFIMIGAVAEELGWRGFVLPRLLTKRSAISSALLIGMIWGVLHLGLILPGQMNAGAHWLPGILYIVGLSVVLTWMYVQTQGSLVIPILFHFGQSYFVFLNGGISLTQQLWLLTAITTAISLVLILIYGSNLQHNPVKEQGL
jgi:hypothetical protein